MNIQIHTHFNIIQIQQHDYPTFFWEKITKMQNAKCKKKKCEKHVLNLSDLKNQNP